MSARVLVVDDEPQILRGLRVVLRSAGYDVATAQTKAEALDAVSVRPPDAMLLDLVLPDGSGVDVCRQVREWSQVPIVVVSAVGDEREKVRALDAGADDYVTKPFGSQELAARLRAVLRRAAETTGEPTITIGELVIDLADRRVRRGDEDVHLTPIEFDLLRVLVLNRGRLVTHRQLLQEVWGPGYADATGNLRLYMAQLRRKLEPDPARPRWLLTEPGMGYRFQPDEADRALR
jgi:two-component system, OmpR family, KDP operon response regulator KdpE